MRLSGRRRWSIKLTFKLSIIPTASSISNTEKNNITNKSNNKDQISGGSFNWHIVGQLGEIHSTWMQVHDVRLF